MEILFYTHKTTSRLTYIVNVICKSILGLNPIITNSKDIYLAHSGLKICYSFNTLNEGVFIQSTQLLFETGINDQQITVSEVNNTPYFFETNKNNPIPFDLFAASFFMISRYEEYLPHRRDLYNRFDATESIAFKNNFLQIPVVNKWALMLKNELVKIQPNHTLADLKYKFISTIDIDNAYAYKEKGITRTLGAFARDLIEINTSNIKQRLRVLFNLEKDPYDTFDYLLGLHKKYNIHPICFFLLADYGTNDKNVSVRSKKFQSLIKSVADYADVGIHPSFASVKNSNKISVELMRLSQFIKRDIIKSRQHFLILHFPETYKQLINNGIKEDYTMGFPSVSGFRAGICTPYLFYDLDNECQTQLTVFPFAVMESTLMYYQKNTPEEAEKIITNLINEVKNVNGTFISLWHNDSLCEQYPWQGWRKVFEHLLVQATK
jgi:hypothetical protein